MEGLVIEERNFFGLFELDEAGTVLYSRIEPEAGETERPARDVNGKNFFKEIVQCENSEELRRRVSRFSASEIQADNFVFHCRAGGGSMPVRVLLARMHKPSNGEQRKSILVHIRKS